MTDSQSTVTLPQFQLIKQRPDQVPPIPDADKARRYLDTNGAYDEGRVHAAAGHYQQLVLHVSGERAGHFYFHGHDWRRGHDEREDLPAASLWDAARYGWRPPPPVIYWTIDAHHNVDERPFLTLAEGNAFAAQVAPLAEALLMGLLPVVDSDTYDWSPEAASAGMDIAAACTRHQHPPVGRRPELLTMAEVVAAHPAIVDPGWLALDDASLDTEAEILTRSAIGRHPAIAAQFGIGPDAEHAAILGTRAWLYEQRHQAAAGRPMKSLADWIADHPGLVTADSTAATLKAVPAQAEADAAARGIYLLGSSSYTSAAYDHREWLREKILAELETYGAARERAEDTVKSLRAAVYSRLYQVFSWEDQHDGTPVVTDTELGKLAHTSRQAVAKVRASVSSDDEETETDA
ncbi:hypothetical protein ACGFMO_37345 [Streptomyces niveus]|uniref:hypothetical protein n=1 Tax=Streptomyces niveus TaxID=193462 RepID=UPI003716F8DB